MNDRNQLDDLMTWIFRLKLGAKPRLILLAMAHEADPETGYFDASMAHVGWKVDLSASQARRYVCDLVAAGLLQVVQASKGRTPSVFGFSVDRGNVKQPSTHRGRVDYTQRAAHERRVRELNAPPIEEVLQRSAQDGGLTATLRPIGEALNTPPGERRVSPPLRIPPTPAPEIPQGPDIKSVTRKKRPAKSQNRHTELIYPVKQALVSALDYQTADLNKVLDGQLFKVASQLVDSDNPVLPDEVRSLVAFARHGEKDGKFSIWWIAPKVGDWRKWQRTPKTATASPAGIRKLTPGEQLALDQQRQRELRRAQAEKEVQS